MRELIESKYGELYDVSYLAYDNKGYERWCCSSKHGEYGFYLRAKDGVLESNDLGAKRLNKATGGYEEIWKEVRE